MRKPLKRELSQRNNIINKENNRRLYKELRLGGFVENKKPYDVRIVAEGEADIISLFIDKIKIKEKIGLSI
ncbi:MAG: acylphosphatase [Methanophagales archaeon]|nr:acylphosphatase [Methanophagales archaeon]